MFQIASFCLLLILMCHSSADSQYLANYSYHNYNALTALLNQYAVRFPNKTHLYSAGKSVQGRELWILALADSQPDRHIILRPDVKYIGNMHGNEVPSKETLLHLIDYLLNSQAADPSVDYLMKNTRIHIMPSMNPDGYENSILGDCYSVTGRYNANGYDLNRNFPDLFQTNPDPIQPETRAVINWFEANSFVLSANFHGGALVVNYPYDDYPNAGDISLANPSSDDDVFQTMGLNYSANNLSFRNLSSDCTVASNGITNGGKYTVVY
jgi:carboxypeptidase M